MPPMKRYAMVLFLYRRNARIMYPQLLSRPYSWCSASVCSFFFCL